MDKDEEIIRAFLAEVDRRITTAEEQVAQQERHITWDALNNCDTVRAEEVLKTFQKSLKVLHSHRSRLLVALNTMLSNNRANATLFFGRRGMSEEEISEKEVIRRLLIDIEHEIEEARTHVLLLNTDTQCSAKIAELQSVLLDSLALLSERRAELLVALNDLLLAE